MMKSSYFLTEGSGDTSRITVMAWTSPDVLMGKDYYMLSRIAVMRGTPTGQGWGTKMLTKVCGEADKHDVILTLGVSPDQYAYFQRLVAWYTRFGFRPYRHRRVTLVHNLMVRMPRASNRPSTGN